VKRAILAVALVLGAVLYPHRSGLHEIVVIGVLALVSLAGLCLLAAGAARLSGGRLARPVRYREPAAQPAVRYRAARPAQQPREPCIEACGRPADRLLLGRWPVCGECAGQLGREDGREDPAPRAGRDPAGRRLDVTVHHWRLGPDGEPLPRDESMIHDTDMADFERRLLS
jgi:hypothetical protein